jgi:hypothetical protein
MSAAGLRHDDIGCGRECRYTPEEIMAFTWVTWCLWLVNLWLAVNVAVYLISENDQREVTELFEYLVFLISPWRYRWWSVWGSFAFLVRGTVGSTDRYNDAPDTAGNWRDGADEVWRSVCTSEFLFADRIFGVAERRKRTSFLCDSFHIARGVYFVTLKELLANQSFWWLDSRHVGGSRSGIFNRI